MRICLLLVVVLISETSFSQKEDINWDFGANCGINFENPDQPQFFQSNAFNFEASASISDTVGNLQFYLSDRCLLNGQHDSILNGTDIRYILEILGHNDPKITMIYARMTIRDLREITSPFDDWVFEKYKVRNLSVYTELEWV